MRTTLTARRLALRLSSVALAVGLAGLGVLADPYTGAAYGASVTDPTNYLDWLENDPAGGIAASGTDAVLDSVCFVGTPLGCAATAGAMYVAAHYGPSLWHWAFGSGHPTPGGGGTPGVGDVAGYGMSVNGTGVITFTYPSPQISGLSYVYYEAANPTQQIGGSLGSFECSAHTSGSVTTDVCSTGGQALSAVCLYDTPHTPYAQWGTPPGVFPGDPCAGLSGVNTAGAGGLTVTGHCYNSSTFAADGTVTGTTAWSSTDTTIPDITLPACPSGDFLGGISITGTGSSATETGGGGFVDGGLGGAPTGGPITGVGTGTDPTGGGPVPQPCLAQSSSCSTVWEQAEGNIWIKISPQDVPVNHGPGYRCELVTSAAVDVKVMPDTACPAPGAGTSPEPSPTTSPSGTPAPPTTILGPPKDDSDSSGAGLDLESCFPNGWGLLNPVEWVLKPIVCAFVPKESVLEADAQSIRSSIGSSALGTVATAVGDIVGSITGITSAASGGGCAGPTLPAVPTVGLKSPTSPLSACATPMATWASYSHGILTFLVYLGGGWVALDVIASAFGFHLPWKRISPWWENSEQQALF